MKNYHTMGQMPYDGGNNLTDWELAVSHWLPHIWTPGKKCHVGMPACRHQGNVQWFDETDPNRWKLHDIPCPPATPELGFRLLEAMKGGCYWNSALSSWSIDSLDVHNICHDPDLLTAITKAAVTLAEKDQ